mgnify:CR=1 FL=1
MFIDLKKARVYVRPGFVDMRQAINGLSIVVQTAMSLDPQSGHLFLFCNRGRCILKALYWERNGFCLWQKRLEKHKFPWPTSAEAARELSVEQLEWLLSGIDFFHAHEELKYRSVV